MPKSQDGKVAKPREPTGDELMGQGHVDQQLQQAGEVAIPPRRPMRGATESFDDRPVDSDFFADMFPSVDEARRAAETDATPETTTTETTGHVQRIEQSDEFEGGIQEALDIFDEMDDADYREFYELIEDYTRALIEEQTDVVWLNQPREWRMNLLESLTSGEVIGDMQNFGIWETIKPILDQAFEDMADRSLTRGFQRSMEDARARQTELEGLTPRELGERQRQAHRDGDQVLLRHVNQEIARRNERTRAEGGGMEVDPAMYNNYGMEFMARQNPDAIDFAALSAEQFAELHQIAQRGNNTALLDALEQEASRRLAQEYRNQQRQAQQETTTQQDELPFEVVDNSLVQQGTAEDLETLRRREDRPDVLQGDTERSRSGFDTAEGRAAARSGTTTENRFDNTTEFPTPDSIMEALDGIMRELEALTPSQTQQKMALEQQMAEAQAALQRRIPSRGGRGTRLNMGIDPTQLGEAARGLWNNIKGALEALAVRQAAKRSSERLEYPISVDIDQVPSSQQIRNRLNIVIEDLVESKILARSATRELRKSAELMFGWTMQHETIRDYLEPISQELGRPLTTKDLQNIRRSLFDEFADAARMLAESFDEMEETLTAELGERGTPERGENVQRMIDNALADVFGDADTPREQTTGWAESPDAARERVEGVRGENQYDDTSKYQHFDNESILDEIDDLRTQLDTLTPTGHTEKT